MGAYQTKEIHTKTKYQTVEHVWKIPKFMEETATSLSSATFDGPNKTKWSIYLYPKGSGNQNNGFLSVFFKLEGSETVKSFISASLAVKIQSINSVIHQTTSFLPFLIRDIGNLSCSWGIPQLINRDNLAPFISKWDKDKSLTLKCKISVMMESENLKLKNAETETSFLENLNESAINQKLITDCHFLCLNNEIVQSHRILLTAQSEVFASCFNPKNGFDECRSGVIKVINFIAFLIEVFCLFVQNGF